MERPCDPKDSVEQASIRLHVSNQTRCAVGHEGKNAVEREKIGSQGDPEISSIGHDVAAFATNLELTNPSSHEPNPDRMGELVAEDVDDGGFR